VSYELGGWRRVRYERGNQLVEGRMECSRVKGKNRRGGCGMKREVRIVECSGHSNICSIERKED